MANLYSGALLLAPEHLANLCTITGSYRGGETTGDLGHLSALNKYSFTRVFTESMAARAVLLADFCLRSVEVIYLPCACAKGLGHLWLPTGLKVSLGPNNTLILPVFTIQAVWFFSCPLLRVHCSGYSASPWYTLHCVSPQDSEQMEVRLLLLLACPKHTFLPYIPLLSSSQPSHLGVLDNLKSFSLYCSLALGLFLATERVLQRHTKINKPGMLVSSCQLDINLNIWKEGIAVEELPHHIVLWTHLWAIFLL